MTRKKPPATGWRASPSAAVPAWLECADRAERAAALIDLAGLPRDGTGGSFVLWQDEHSIAWLNVMPERRDTGCTTMTARQSAST